MADCITYASDTICSRCADPKMPIIADVVNNLLAGSSCSTGSVSKCKSYSAINVCIAC